MKKKKKENEDQQHIKYITQTKWINEDVWKKRRRDKHNDDKRMEVEYS